MRAPPQIGYTTATTMFDLLFWGITLGTFGKIVLGITVVSVHWKIVKEHKIDGAVLKEIRKERNFAIFAILCILVGYMLEIAYYDFF